MSVIRAQTKNAGIQGGSHYVWDLDADFELTIDVLKEVERLGETINRIT
jgi:hypothetical protein